jgi:hypothetical protein
MPCFHAAHEPLWKPTSRALTNSTWRRICCSTFSLNAEWYSQSCSFCQLILAPLKQLAHSYTALHMAWLPDAHGVLSAIFAWLIISQLAQLTISFHAWFSAATLIELLSQLLVTFLSSLIRASVLSRALWGKSAPDEVQAFIWMLPGRPFYETSMALLQPALQA